jgi:glycosyltransferase involved in cell wall biosynthesis
LKPHAALVGDTRDAYLEFTRAMLCDLDTFISLSQSGVSEAIAAYPELGGVPYVVARHPHYRSLVRQSTNGAQLRQALGVPSGAYLLGCIGTVLPYKGVVEAAEAFSLLNGQDLRLLVVGPLDAQCKDRLRKLAEIDRRLILLDRPLDDREIADWHSAVDAVLFNGASNLNSGSLLMALSLNRPVLAPGNSVNREMACLVGESWMSLFDHPLDQISLRAHIDQLRSCAFENGCDLSAFDPVASARSLVRAYSGRAASSAM